MPIEQHINEYKTFKPTTPTGEVDEYDRIIGEPLDGETQKLIGSKTKSGLHRPVLDIDFACRLLASKTPGHYHLYLDGIELCDEAYGKLLDALHAAGVIQKGIKKQFELGGQTQVRMKKRRFE